MISRFTTQGLRLGLGAALNTSPTPRRPHSASLIALVLLLLCSTLTKAATRDEVILYLNDPLGSAIAAFDEDGELCWEETYTPYGEKTQRDDSFNRAGCGHLAEERGFTGHTEDYETDLVYMQQRYYDPTIGRFLSPDPIGPIVGDPRTVNRYAYAANNPYKYVDPNGELFFVPLLAFVAKEVAAEIASHYTHGATDILSARRLASKALSFGTKQLAKKKTDDVAKQVGNCSFIGSTPVLTDSGLKTIDSIVAGLDLVWSKDEITNTSDWQPVLQAYSSRYDITVTIQLETENGTQQTLISNTIHPFFVVRDKLSATLKVTYKGDEASPYRGNIPNGQWIEAADLKAGDRLLGSDSQWQTVTRLTVEDKPLKAHNLDVANSDSYFVGGVTGGIAGVWVHNCDVSKSGGQKLGDPHIAKGQRGAVGSRRAPEFDGGKVSESGFLGSAEKWLGAGYKSLPNGRYVSKDGLRQVRYGRHETNNKRHHGHFEAYNRPGGKVIENTSVEITP